MADTCKLAILSDIHYAGPAERALGGDYEFRTIGNPLLRNLLKLHRRFLWLHKPLEQAHLLDKFITDAGELDYVIANGDFSCNCASVGLSDDASFQSAAECLGKLRGGFGERLLTVYGDHDIGKLSFLGGHGGMRLASLRRAERELKMPPFWRVKAGDYVLMGVTSSLIALSIFEPDMLPEERAGWEQARGAHMSTICAAFAALRAEERVLLFCHDPTALPFLWREESVRSRLNQVEQTIIGHLHSNLIFWKGQLLAGMPVIRFLGHSPKRWTTALNEARHWRPFKVRLCPALAGIELLKDGGYLTVDLDIKGRGPAVFRFHSVPR